MLWHNLFSAQQYSISILVQWLTGGFEFYWTSRVPLVSPEGAHRPSEPLCKVIFENEEQEQATPNKPLGTGGRRRSLVSSEPQHVTLIVFGIGMVNRTHLEADIGGLTMEAELKKIHGSFTLKEKMKGEAEPELFFSGQRCQSCVKFK